jgi:hypothetical protein
MKNLSAKFVLLLLLLQVSILLKAQPITGTKTVCTSGCDYVSLNAAVSALNLNGVGAGGAIIEIANGHTETLPNPGLSLGSATLNPSLTAAKPLVFRKSLTPGPKPVFTSGSGTGGIDAMFRLIGVDYVSLENLVFVEASTNLSSTTQYEYGIMLVKRNSVSPVDGCQYNAIKDCEITFRRNTFMTQTGIYAANHLATNTSNITYTLSSDAHSFNKIERNIITNGQHGIYFSGINSTTAATSLYDQGNVIGTENNGNIIRRFGSNNTSIASGIIAYYQNNLLIEGNTISGGGTTFTSTLNGIDLQRIARAIVRANTISDTSSTGTNNGVFINNTNSRLFIDSNFIVNCLSLNATFNGINAVASDTLVLSANRIANNRYQGAAQGIFTGIQLTNASNKYALVIRNEIFNNYSNNSFYAINLFGSQGIGRVFQNRIYSDTCLNGQHIAIFNNQNSNQVDSVVGNEIFDLINLFNGSVIGYLKPVTGTANTGVKLIESNTIYNLRTKLGTVKGIEYNNSNAAVNINRNKIFGLRSDSINVTLTGIEIGSGLLNANIINNLINDFETYNSPIVGNMYGIYINNSVASNVSRIYHNTIYFNAQNSGNLVSYCLRAGIFSQVETRNNVFVNKSLATLNGFNAAYYREGSNLATYRLGSNHNLFYSSGTPGRYAIYFDAATIDSTLAQFKNRVSPRESDSYFEDVVFQQAFFQPYNLAPNSTVPSQIESGANFIDTPITVLRDIEGQLRSAKYPDIGCYEGNFLPADLVKPAVSYLPLNGVSPYQAAPQVRVIATDRFGIKVAASNRPRLYFKKKTDANVWVSNSSANGGWKMVQTSDSLAPFNFQLNYSLLQSALLPGDTIEFFATAEDSNGNVGAGSVSLQGLVPSTTLSAANFPVTGSISFIPIFDTLSGTFTVGTGGNFNSLTAALRRFQASVQTGPVTLILTNAIYATPAFGGLETFPLSLRPSIGMSTTNTLLIKPATGVNPLIFGAADSALFVVRDGVVGFTFDGSNSNSNTRNLSLLNTHNNGQSVLFIQSNNTNGGVKNLEIKNLNLKGGNLATTQIIIIGARTGIGAQAIVKASGANNLSIRNCNLYFGLSGLMAVGEANSPITNLLVENNRFSTDSFNLNLAGTGIYAEGITNSVFNKNTIRNMFTQFVQLVSGITIGDNVSNTSIKYNIIDNIESANNNSTGCYGISISSGIGVNNDSIYNNSISRIMSSSSGNGFGNIFNRFGIRVTGGTNIKVFYNTVHLSGGSSFGSGQSASGAMQVFGTGPFTGLEIRNNVFSNSMSNSLSGSRHTAIWVSTTLPIAGATINRNNYFVNGFNGFLLFDGSNNYNTLSDLISVLGGNANSISANPLFVSNSDLRPVKGGVLRIGNVIAGINRDILDSLRSNTLTRIGCYENEYDINPPIFGSHQNATNSGASPLRTLTAITITDSLSGVNLINGRRPRVYFKKKSEGNGFGLNQSSFNGWKFVETSSNASPYSFTLNYNLLTSLPVVGDSIFYFFVAADSAGNYAALPSAGFGSVSYDSLLTPPNQPYRFRIVAPPLAGVYRVGTGGNYTTLTAAVTDINQRGVSGPVTFLLTQTTYSPPTESFPFTFSNLIQGASATNTISIRPANGVQVSIIGSAAPIFYLNGCNFVTINGSDTLSKSGRKITITNTGNAPCVIIENDASFNQIRNCNLYSDPIWNAAGIIKFGDRLLTGNDNNVIDSCLIGAYSPFMRPWVCISAYASIGPSHVLSSNNVISNNEIANPNNFGIYIDNTNENYTITGNSFYKSYTYNHISNFSFIGYYANGGLISNNFFGGSAAYCGGNQTTNFDGTSGTFSLLNLQGLNITARQNTFRRIQFTGFFNNGNHSLIGVLNGKVTLQDNILGADTGLGSIQINYTNPVGVAGFSAINIGNGSGTALDSVQVIGNTIGSINATGGGLISLYGIRFNASSGNFIVRDNFIGSNLTPGSITQSCNGDIMGIEFTVNGGQNLLLENNTVRNLQYTLHHSRVLNGIFVSTNTPALVRGNVVQRLFHSPVNASLIVPGFTFLNGMYLTLGGNGQRMVIDNRIQQIHTTTNPSGRAVGLQALFPSTISAEVARNSVTGIGPNTTAEAFVTGINLQGDGLLFHNNEVVLGIDSNGNSLTGPSSYFGVFKSGIASKVFHNSVNIAGNNVATTGAFYTAAFIAGTGNAQDSVFNNIFINQRSNISATGSKNYSTYFLTAPYPVMNRNLLLANGNNGFIGYAASTDYLTLPLFASATNTNAQSRSKSVSFFAPWNLRLAGSSIGDTALAGIPLSLVRTDIDNQFRDPFKPYMGCDENVANPLPVNLLSFKASKQEQDAFITWQTSQEINNKGFYLERSFDGLRFEPIAFYAGAIHSNASKFYHHTDKEVFLTAKQVYYRLIQEDLDGKQTDLGTRALASELSELISLYPNPSKDRFWIKGIEGLVPSYIKVYQASGLMLLSEVNYNVLSKIHSDGMYLGTLPKGIYLIEMMINDEIVFRKLSVY